MKRTGIEALAPQPGTSKAAPGNNIYPYLLRKLPIVHANQVWAAYFSPLWTAFQAERRRDFSVIVDGISN